MKQLQTIDADTLMSTPLPVIKFIVEGLLPEGLHILAGAPKVGKSWLALWICLQVSKSEPVWELQTTHGTVLYLCLEDSYVRIQNRLFQLTDDAPNTLHFANLSSSIGAGLENQITAFLSEHPDTNLIVIDTLQKIRDSIPDKNSYASDYRDLSSMKNLAENHHVAILLTHHLRKMKDDDPMNMISGTTGISGATDSNFVLKRKDRSSPRAELHCTGQDIESRILELCFQKEAHTWELAKHTFGLEKSGVHISNNRTRETRQLCITCEPCEAVCAAFRGWPEEAPTTGEIGHVERLWADFSRSTNWSEMVRGPGRGNAHLSGGASIAPGYTPCRTRRGKAPAPPAPEGEKGAKCRRRKRRSSQLG